MKEEKFIDAIGNLDDSLIEETAAPRNRKKPFPYYKLALVAACILLTVVLIPWKTLFSDKGPVINDPPEPEEAVDVLKNEDTTAPDTEKAPQGPAVIPPDDSTQTPHEDSLPDKEQIQTDVPDTTGPQPENIQIPDTMGPQPENIQIPDTTGPTTDYNPSGKDQDTPVIEEETTGPLPPDKPTDPTPVVPTPQRPSVLSRASYPQQTQYSLSTLKQWRNEKNERINYYHNGIGNTDDFMNRTVREFFSNSEKENLIFSPVNTYLSLGMLAEATAGVSRAQLLSLLGENDITGIRSSAKNLWNCCYRDDGIVTSVLGNSMWFDDSFVPNTETTDIIAENYYASSFWGDFGDAEYDELMRSWINEQTKDMLKNTVNGSSLDPEEVISVISTLYFKADWSTAFQKKHTQSRVFHSPDGDIETEFMFRDESGELYYGESFSATSLKFEEGGAMWFILPDEDVELQSLFSDPEAMGFITGSALKGASFNTSRILLYVPKFDITTELDLEKNLKSLGVTEVFDPLAADFSSLTDSQVYVKDINTSVRVRIDEYGCEAAAVNTWDGGYGAAPFVNFRIDRPFIFVITSDSGLPLFVGTVNRPDR